MHMIHFRHYEDIGLCSDILGTHNEVCLQMHTWCHRMRSLDFRLCEEMLLSSYILDN